MTGSNLSLMGAFVFLVAGVLLQAVLERGLYPFLSDAWEKAKVTGNAGIDPSRLFFIARIINFLVLPIIGLFAGGMIWAG
jgi:hypothetical protein